MGPLKKILLQSCVCKQRKHLWSAESFEFIVVNFNNLWASDDDQYYNCFKHCHVYCNLQYYACGARLSRLVCWCMYFNICRQCCQSLFTGSCLLWRYTSHCIFYSDTNFWRNDAGTIIVYGDQRKESWREGRGRKEWDREVRVREEGAEGEDDQEGVRKGKRGYSCLFFHL